MCSRNFSVLINQSQKTPEIFFSFYLQTLHQSTNSRRFALRANPAPLPVLQHTLPFHTQQSHADLPSRQIQPLLPSSNTLSPSTQQSHADLPSGQIQTTPPVLQPQDLAPASWHLPRRQAHWHRRHADDARVGGSRVRMTDGHPGRKSRGSETGNHQISCRIASVPQSTASHTSSSARRCHRARLCGRCHGAGARSVPPPHTQIEQPTPHRLLHKSSFDGS